MYISKRILCPTKNLALSNTQLMEEYAKYFGEDTWVSFSECPSITLTWLGNDEPSTLQYPTSLISIDSGCYIESSLLPAFPSGPTKLTCVNVNNAGFGSITIGKDCVLQGTCICAYQSVCIGDRVIFGPNVVVMDCSGHAVDHRGSADELSNLKIESVKIGNDVWLGYGVIILPGVTIGERSVIGAGSVVTKDIPNDSVAAGNPCVVKHHIKNNNK